MPLSRTAVVNLLDAPDADAILYWSLMLVMVTSTVRGSAGYKVLE